MSNPSNKPHNPFDVSAYAPKRLRDQPLPEDEAHEKSISDYFSPPGAALGKQGGPPRPAGERFIENFRVPHSLDPYVFEEPAAAGSRRRFSLLQIGIAAVAAFALGAPAVHYLWIEASPPRAGKSDNFGSRFDLVKSKIEDRIALPAPPPPLPQAVTESASAPAPVAAPSVQPALAQPAPAPQQPQNALLENDRKLAPPPAAQSPPARGAAAAPPAPVAKPVQPAPEIAPAPKLGPDQIEVLMKQGERFIAAGDFVTARVVFHRAAEAGEAKAALALGATFDPAMLAKLGARGVKGDLAEARNWYEKAKDLGSAEAGQRLEQMAQRR